MINQNKKVALKFATFAALFWIMSFFMEMMEETEEQTTYSVTLESLASAGVRRTHRPCPPDNPCYRGYHNHTKIIRNYRGSSIYSYVRRGSILPVAGLRITVGASGALTYCRRSFFLFFWQRCYKNLNGWRPFFPNVDN